MLRHVLVCLDGSPLGERALPHAVAIAKALGARVSLLRVLETAHAGPGHAPADAFAWEISRTEAREYLDELTRRRGDDVECTAHVRQGHAADQIEVYAESGGVDLVALSSHGEGGLGHTFLASTALKVIESVPGSLLVVPASDEPPDEVRYRRVMVALDGSRRAESALPFARRIASTHAAELLAAHVVPHPPLVAYGPPSAEDEELCSRLLRRNRRKAALYLDQLGSRLGGGPLRTILCDNGDVRSRLADIAHREQADLVVMSAHGATGRCDSGYGSVASHLLAHLGRPLLLVQDLPRSQRRRCRAQRPGRSLAHPRDPDPTIAP